MGSWLVETAWLEKRDNEWDWWLRSGHTSERGAREEARQCGARWRRQGFAVRVRYEAGDATPYVPSPIPPLSHGGGRLPWGI